MPDRSCLTGDTAALNVDKDVKLIQGFAQLKRLSDNHSMEFTEEMRLEWPPVHPDVSGSRSQKNASRGCFPPTRSVILN